LNLNVAKTKHIKQHEKLLFKPRVLLTGFLYFLVALQSAFFSFKTYRELFY